ncbi:hypothetical protein FPV67DRAFT_1653292 [Lyophyllum atratum]|nr:hypothetical protein FPV67DRAFT_1653292 [Lyophyllum atratum]
MSVKMLGYIVSDEQMLDYGMEMKLGTDESKNAKHNTIVEAATHLFVRGGLFGHGRLVGVRVNGKLRRCLAVASNDAMDPSGRRPLLGGGGDEVGGVVVVAAADGVDAGAGVGWWIHGHVMSWAWTRLSLGPGRSTRMAPSLKHYSGL